jgi:hypothetical protein
MSDGPSNNRGCGPLVWIAIFIIVIVAVIAISQTGLLHGTGRLP